MSRMPGAEWLGEHSPQRRMARYDIVCVHTIVGYAPAHAAHFSVKADGRILQSRDTDYQSAANLYGNPRIIAIENEDHGGPFPSWSGSNVPPLTAAQVESNARILAWAHKEHGVPLQLCPDSRPGSRGLAYHRQGIDGNFGPFRFPGRVPGGEVWTSSFGKVCPGDNRIAQRPAILERARELVAPPKPPRPAPVVKVTGIDTLRLGSDHRAVIYRLTLDGKPWMVATYNMGGKATAVDVQHLIARLDAMSPDRWTLCLQETGDQGKTLRHVVAATPDVELVQGPEGLGRAKLATIVPTGTLERHALVKLTDRTFVGPKGAGGLYTDHKYLLRTRQEVDGTVVRVGNVHLMSSVQGPPTPWRALRRALHRKQLAGAIEWVGKPSVPTVAVGDWNAVPTSPLMDPLRKAGLKIHGRGSHGGPKKNRRAIDLLVHP